MRKIIAALQVSLDGFIEGADGELDWIASWEDQFGLMPEIDACILGGGMYPGYEHYWSAIQADPNGVLEFTGRPPTSGEIDYAAFAARTPHYVVSTKLATTRWKGSQLVRDLTAIRMLKAGPGRNIHLVGGATLVSSMMNERLVDELRVVVNPVVLGRGKALFKDVSDSHLLHLAGVEQFLSGQVKLTYSVQS